MRLLLVNHILIFHIPQWNLLSAEFPILVASRTMTSKSIWWQLPTEISSVGNFHWKNPCPLHIFKIILLFFYFFIFFLFFYLVPFSLCKRGEGLSMVHGGIQGWADANSWNCRVIVCTVDNGTVPIEQ